MSRPALNAYLAAARGKPFRYGTHDCALFAARWVQAQTGRDLTLGIRYNSLRDGLDQLAPFGFSDHVEVAAARLPEIPVVLAAPGDVAAVPGPRQSRVLGIITGERIAVVTRQRGVCFVPLTNAARAFRVEKDS